MNHLIFVYGTLKQGYQNHHHIKDSIFMGTGKTVNKYAMYQKNYPFVVKNKAVSFVYGEVYSVDDNKLALLDHLERYLEWYCRKQVDVVFEGGGTVISAWLYFNATPEGTLVDSGKFHI